MALVETPANPPFDPTGIIYTAPLPDEQLRAFIQNAGFVGEQVTVAMAVCRAESGGIPARVNSIGATGLFQVLPSAHPDVDLTRLKKDPAYACQLAFQWSNGGANWDKDWYASHHSMNGKPPAYLAYMPGGKAESAVGGDLSGVVTLAGSAAATPAIPAIDQTPFDPKMRRIAQTRYAPALFHGAMATDPAQNPNGQVVHFLYNPALISLNYSTDPTRIPQNQDDISQQGLPTASSPTTITFSLFFDRTYEVNQGSITGVLDDVTALERMCGITSALPFMQAARIKIVFGIPVDFQFWAIISGFQVQYNHFNINMVPMRCEIDITATRQVAGAISLNLQSTAGTLDNLPPAVYGVDDQGNPLTGTPGKPGGPPLLLQSQPGKNTSA